MNLKINDSIRLKINPDYFSIEDSNKPKSIRVKIEASHAGKININNVFYTPKALRQGCESLVKPYTKMLQKCHYSKSVGPIEKSYYVDSIDTSSSLYQNISNASTPAALVSSVHEYLNSEHSKKNNKGLGSMFLEGTIHDEQKIVDILDHNAGFVSIAGDSKSAFCSICSSVAGICTHKPGLTYNKRKAFVIVDSSELDHVSFEEDPADRETHTYVIEDSSLPHNIDILNTNNQGQHMKITLSDLKSKLSDLPVLLTEFKIKPDYTISDSVNISDFLFVEDSLLPLTSKASLYLADKLLFTLEDSTDKDFLTEKVQAASVVLGVDLLTLEEELVEKEVEETVPPVVPTTTDNVSVDLLLAISELSEKLTALSTSVLTLQDSNKGTDLQKSEIAALRKDNATKSTVISKLTTQLKDSVISKFTSKIEDAAKRDKLVQDLSTKSLSELETALTLLDSVSATTITPAPEVKEEEVTQPELKPATIDTAILDTATKTDAELEKESKDQLITDYVATLEIKDNCISKTKLKELYKTVALKDGFDTAQAVVAHIQQTFTLK
jgi:hypothetical protein